MHYATLDKYTPAQLIFGRDSIINRRRDVDWETLRKQKQDLINKSKYVKIVIK